MSKLTVAATQMACSWFERANRAFFNSLAMIDVDGSILGVYRKSHIPTAIGSEPPPAMTLDSKAHWQRTMQGHAAANMVPLVASNRIGREQATQDAALEITFYGHSFIADYCGEIITEADDRSESILLHQFDMAAIRGYRDAWGIYRDRRPDLYQTITTLDGRRQQP